MKSSLELVRLQGNIDPAAPHHPEVLGLGRRSELLIPPPTFPPYPAVGAPDCCHATGQQRWTCGRRSVAKSTSRTLLEASVASLSTGNLATGGRGERFGHSHASNRRDVLGPSRGHHILKYRPKQTQPKSPLRPWPRSQQQH